VTDLQKLEVARMKGIGGGMTSGASSSRMNPCMEGILQALAKVGALLERQARRQACGERKIQG